MGGLNPRESAIVVSYLQHLREHGMGTLLVEHDMSLTMEVADRIVVLNYGQKIAEGTPTEIGKNPLVIEAYLGEEHRA